MTKLTLWERLTWPKPETDIAMMRETAVERAEATAAKMQPASVVLQSGLERAALQFHDREQALLREIADREAELSDVRKASAAATAALMELATDEALEVFDPTPVRETAHFKERVELARELGEL